MPFAGLNATARHRARSGWLATHDATFTARRQLTLDVHRPANADGAPADAFSIRKGAQSRPLFCERLRIAPPPVSSFPQTRE